MSKKLTIEEMYELAYKKNGKCLSTEYINNKTKLKWQCNKCNHIWEASPNNIKQDGWCPQCIEKAKLTIEKMYELAFKKDGKCLSTEYINIKTKLEWQCNKCNHIWMARPDSIKQDSWCPKCVEVLKLTIEEMYELASKKNGKCLSTKYINNCTHLKWQCNKCNYIWEAIPNSIKQDSWCPRCSDTKLTIEEMHELAYKKNGKCLSTEYINSKTKLEWQCKKGHIWETSPNNIKQDKWCPKCAGSVGENLTRQVFEEFFNKPFPSVRPKFLKYNRCLQLDGFNEELKMAFEYQGNQHYTFPNHCHKTIEEYNKQLEHDQWKKEQCEKNNIRLFIINQFDDLDYSKVKLYIENLLTEYK
jgi:predicted Zn-ribbon and HTH transcriptional regulator